MSLFRLREWWNFQPGDDESECSSASLCAFRNEEKRDQADLLVIGTLTGVLRIFDVSGNLADQDNIEMGFKAEHLLLEKRLGDPILQVAAGVYVSSSDKSHLAVLHPNKLSVYSFGTVSVGQVEHGNQYSLTLIYEHRMQRNVYNFIDGPFGNISGRHFFCVQSLDGALSFFEQENFAFTRFLPEFLLPGPLAYLRRSDSFLTVSSNWQLECYKYQALAMAGDAKTREDSEKLISGKRVVMSWAYRLGEMVLDIQAVEISPAPPSIVVLGERTAFCLTEQGHVRFMKKLDYEPSCLLVYGATSEGQLQWVVGSHTSTLLFYVDTLLKWTAQVSFVPVAIKTVSFGFFRNMLAVMGDSGSLICAFLATDPAFYGVNADDHRHVDYSSKRQQFRELQAIVKSSKNSLDIIKRGEEQPEMLHLICHVVSKVDAPANERIGSAQDDISVISAKVILKARHPVENVQLYILVSPPIVVERYISTFATISDSEEMTVTFSVRNILAPAHLKINLKATYTTYTGAGAVSMASSRFPLTFVAGYCPPPKSAVHKITIDSNKPLLRWRDIFSDILPADLDDDAEAIGFQLHGRKAAVGLLASKQRQKYRVQADKYEQISLFLDDLMYRLKRYYANDANFHLTYSGTLPLAEYFALIDNHFELYRQKLKLCDSLANRTAQFRIAERQLLRKLGDTSPTPMTQLDALIEMTFKQISSLATTVQETDAAIRLSRISLMSGTQLFVTLAAMAFQLSPSEERLLESAFHIDSGENSEQAYEEHVDTALVYLLQVMSKNSGGSSASGTVGLQRLADSTRLKKHIMLLNEKLSKGGRLPSIARVKEEKAKQSKSKATPMTSAVVGPSNVSRTLEPIAEDTNWHEVVDEHAEEAGLPPIDDCGQVRSNRRKILYRSDFGTSVPDDPITDNRPATSSSTNGVSASDTSGSSRPIRSSDRESNPDRAKSASRNRSKSAKKRAAATEEGENNEVSLEKNEERLESEQISDHDGDNDVF